MDSDAVEPPNDEHPAEEETPTQGERPGGLLSQIDPHVVLYHDPRSIHAEQYRACRTNLVALNEGGSPWAVVVTGSRRGEGTSITAANLAASLAELPGTRVCLVDANFRNPRQRDIFGLEMDAVVSELLSGDAALTEVIHSTLIPGLDLVTAGVRPESPSELLGSDRFSNFLDEIRRRYSWILIDSPPVHPFTDACVLGPAVNGTLVVVRMEDTNRDLVDHTVVNIESAGGKVLGTFLTGLSPDRDDRAQGNYYQNAHAYRATSKKEQKEQKEKSRAEKQLLREERTFLKKKKEAEEAERLDEPEV